VGQYELVELRKQTEHCRRFGWWGLSAMLKWAVRDNRTERVLHLAIVCSRLVYVGRSSKEDWSAEIDELITLLAEWDLGVDIG
jgi:hypothetical protein